MRLWYTHIWKSRAYRSATADERRLIDIRFSVARTLKDKRRACRITQCQLAQKLGVAQSSISRIERATNYSSIDLAIRAFIALGSPDDEIGAALNASRHPSIQALRRRLESPPFYKPGTSPSEDRTEHRFIRKRN